MRSVTHINRVIGFPKENTQTTRSTEWNTQQGFNFTHSLRWRHRQTIAGPMHAPDSISSYRLKWAMPCTQLSSSNRLLIEVSLRQLVQYSQTSVCMYTHCVWMWAESCCCLSAQSSTSNTKHSIPLDWRERWELLQGGGDPWIRDSVIGPLAQLKNQTLMVAIRCVH